MSEYSIYIPFFKAGSARKKKNTQQNRAFIREIIVEKQCYARGCDNIIFAFSSGFVKKKTIFFPPEPSFANNNIFFFFMKYNIHVHIVCVCTLF